MIPKSDSSNQTSATPIIGVKMQKLEPGDHIPLANTEDDFGMISKYIKPPATGTYILGSVNGSIEWIGTKDCE